MMIHVRLWSGQWRTSSLAHASGCEAGVSEPVARPVSAVARRVPFASRRIISADCSTEALKALRRQRTHRFASARCPRPSRLCCACALAAHRLHFLGSPWRNQSAPIPALKTQFPRSSRTKHLVLFLTSPSPLCCRTLLLHDCLHVITPSSRRKYNRRSVGRSTL